MNYTGIDYHKRYSVACTLDGQGRLMKQARIHHNAPEAFAAYFEALGGPSEAVIEACWNWATLYDVLEDTPGVAKVVLSNPAKNRIIAEHNENLTNGTRWTVSCSYEGDYLYCCP